MKRNFVTYLIFTLLSTTAFAQDVITFRSGDVVRAKVIEVYIDEVTYIKENNPDGPKYTVPKEDIDSIVYKNGTSDVFCSAVRKSSHKGWFFSPEIGLGIMEDFSYGLTFSTGYQFNDLFSAGAGCTISQQLEEDPAFSAFALAHFNFGHKPGHWFYECRVGADFAYDEPFIDHIGGYQFKPRDNQRGNLYLSYTLHLLSDTYTGNLLSIGYRF